MKKRQKIRKLILNISLVLFPLTFYYLSPVLILESSFFGIVNASAIIFLLLLLSAIFLGRLWCGWVCPGGAAGEACMKVRDKRVSNKYNFIKYLIWVPWLITIAYLVLRAGGYHKVAFFYQTFYGLSISGPESIVAFIIVLAVITIPNLILGRRAMCHYLCWMAPFMIIGQKIGDLLKIPRVHLSTKRDDCINCMSCTKNCPMSLEVNDMVQKGDLTNSECILCGTCIDVCPKSVIKYDFGKGK